MQNAKRVICIFLKMRLTFEKVQEWVSVLGCGRLCPHPTPPHPCLAPSLRAEAAARHLGARGALFLRHSSDASHSSPPCSGKQPLEAFTAPLQESSDGHSSWSSTKK